MYEGDILIVPTPTCQKHQNPALIELCNGYLYIAQPFLTELLACKFCTETLYRNLILTGAYLRGAYLTGADLRGADLTGADLTGADLTGADLTGADLTEAEMPDGWEKVVFAKP